MSITFIVDPAQQVKLRAWRAEQDEIVRLKQLQSDDAFIRGAARGGEAYYGAVGGELTYCFTPNSIGETFVVKHCGGAEIDLTDYDSW